MAKTTVQPWERREDTRETLVAYAAFLAYRDMGIERSLKKVGAQLGKSEGLMERWSMVHGWPERVLAWEAYVQREADRAVVKDLVKTRRRVIRRILDKIDEGLARIDLLNRKADTVLQLPVVKREVDEDGQRVVIMPADAALLNAAGNLVAKADASEQHLLAKLFHPFMHEAAAQNGPQAIEPGEGGDDGRDCLVIDATAAIPDEEEAD